MQDKAPMRSQAIGPVMLGERQEPTDKSTQRHFCQSQHGSGWSDVHRYYKLSIPAITSLTHAGVSSAGFEGLLVKIRGILAASVAVKDKALARFSFPDGHQHGVIGQISHHTQPTTARENRSITTAKYSQPSCVEM